MRHEKFCKRHESRCNLSVDGKSDTEGCKLMVYMLHHMVLSHSIDVPARKELT